MKLVARPDLRDAGQMHIRAHDTTRANFHAGKINNRTGSDFHGGMQLGFGMNNGGGMYHLPHRFTQMAADEN